MAMDCEVASRIEKIEVLLSAPQPGDTHWIECRGYRCLGILDQSGKWRCFASGKEITEVIKVYYH